MVFRIVKCESLKYKNFIYKNALAFDVTCHFMLICRPNYICGFASISVQILLKGFRRYIFKITLFLTMVSQLNGLV
jgi:hypothetical protein